MTADDRSLRRDFGFFLPCFATGIGLGLIDSTSVHIARAVGLLIAYGAYARRTVRHSGESEEVDELKPLTFDPSKEDPPHNIAIVAQLVVGLLVIVGGAELFVEEVVTVAGVLGISALVLSLVLAPLATELPEKLNSVLWMRRDKDTLAVGNITGAMAFQSTVPIALGLAVTDWDLDRFAVAAGVAKPAAPWRCGGSPRTGTPSSRCASSRSGRKAKRRAPVSGTVTGEPLPKPGRRAVGYRLRPRCQCLATIGLVPLLLTFAALTTAGCGAGVIAATAARGGLSARRSA